MALQGTIDSFPLDDVLGFVSGPAQSGVLRVEGDRGTVRLWIADGAIVGAESAGAAVSDPVHVVFEALRFRAGSFSFDDDPMGPAERLDPRGIPAVVREAAELRDEWDAIEAVLPSPAHRLNVVVPLPQDHVTLDAGSWRIVTALGRTDTVASVLARSGLSDLDAARGLVVLVRQGLVEVVGPAATEAEPAVVVDEIDLERERGAHSSDASVGTGRAEGGPRADEHVRVDLGEFRIDDDSLRATASYESAPAAISADRFPIDDLVDVQSAEDPWTSSTERVAQPFAPATGPVGVGAPTEEQPAAFAAPADEAAADPVLEQATWMSQGAADAIAEVLGSPAGASGGRTYEGGDPAFR